MLNKGWNVWLKSLKLMRRLYLLYVSSICAINSTRGLNNNESDGILDTSTDIGFCKLFSGDISLYYENDFHNIKKLANSNVKYFFLENIYILYTLFIHHHYCMRLDIYISQTYALSRNRAQFIIQEWLVLVNEKTVKKLLFP